MRGQAGFVRTKSERAGRVCASQWEGREGLGGQMGVEWSNVAVYVSACPVVTCACALVAPALTLSPAWQSSLYPPPQVSLLQLKRAELAVCLVQREDLYLDALSRLGEEDKAPPLSPAGLAAIAAARSGAGALLCFILCAHI